MILQFDKIYVISLIYNKQRQDFITYQFNKLGINFEFIYGIDYYNLRYNSEKEEIVFTNVYQYDVEEIEKLGKNFGCAISHYQAILQAYEFGYNNVLIIEDDVCLRKNIVEKYLNNIPEDADFITYDVRFKSDEYDNIEYNMCHSELLNNKNTFIKISNKYDLLTGAMMYGIMNRNTMKLYLQNQRKYLSSADNILGIWYKPCINRYICNKCICTDMYNIQNNFNIKELEYKCIYKDIENLSINDFYIPNNVDEQQIFTR